VARCLDIRERSEVQGLAGPQPQCPAPVGFLDQSFVRLHRLVSHLPETLHRVVPCLCGIDGDGVVLALEVVPQLKTLQGKVSKIVVVGESSVTAKRAQASESRRRSLLAVVHFDFDGGIFFPGRGGVLLLRPKDRLRRRTRRLDSGWRFG